MLAKRSLIMLSRQQQQRLPEVLDVMSPGPGLLDEKMLLLVLRAANWNPFVLCTSAQVCKRWADIMKRVVWKEFCLSRAPKMVGHLLSGGRDGSIPGGWEPLGKLMFYCSGCHASTHFISNTIPGHFVWKTRFSKTSGKWFLIPQCQADILYISKICEHLDNGDDDDLVLYRGIFSSFGTSRTRRVLMERGAKLEEDELCPFCRDKVWSMTDAKMVPPSAVKRLVAYEDNVEYFVCVNGHLHGMASRISPSDSELSADE
jgi:hypothetical protein